MSETMNMRFERVRAAGADAMLEASFHPIAAQAIAMVASRFARRGPLDPVALKHLEAAAFHADRGRRLGVIDAMRTAGIADEEIVDHYIPDVARTIGQRWLEDEMTFADVTIGSSRLQALVRDVAAAWDFGADDGAAPSVLVVVREGEDHSLGASIAATQLRRLGAAVRVSLCRSDREVATELRCGAYDMVALSASPSEKVKDLKDFVARLREAGGEGLKTAIGGSILSSDVNLEEALSIDVATADPAEALDRCGLKTSSTARMRVAPGQLSAQTTLRASER